MIFWSGHGILILLFWIVGAIAGAFLGSVGMFWGAALMGWFYVLTLGKTKTTILLNPQTGAPVHLKKRHTLMFIPVFGCAVLMSVLTLIMTLTGGIKDVGSRSGADGNKPADFKTAEKWISSKDQSISGGGNTSEAKALASAFSDAVTNGRNIAISQTRASSMSGDFQAWCQISPHGVAFIVQVPQLRKFTKEAKETMCELSWITARTLASQLDPAPASIAVGVKGMILYEKIMVGSNEGDLEKNSFAGVINSASGSDTGILLPFFEKVQRDPTPAKPKATPSDAAPVGQAGGDPQSATESGNILDTSIKDGVAPGNTDKIPAGKDVTVPEESSSD